MSPVAKKGEHDVFVAVSLLRIIAAGIVPTRRPLAFATTLDVQHPHLKFMTCLRILVCCPRRETSQDYLFSACAQQFQVYMRSWIHNIPSVYALMDTHHVDMRVILDTERLRVSIDGTRSAPSTLMRHTPQGLRRISISKVKFLHEDRRREKKGRWAQ